MIELAYINGVLHGDGWCKQALGLRVKDYDFCKVFSDAFNKVFGTSYEPRIDERGYWLFRVWNKNGKYNHLLEYEPIGIDQYSAWLRGLFDSEGNAQLIKLKRGNNSYGRRVSIFSTNSQTLFRASKYLSEIGINSAIRETKNSDSHKGRKTVFELNIRSSKENYRKFRDFVGTNIERKKVVLDKIVNSYVDDLSQHYRLAQLKGATSKKMRTMNETLPKVVIGVRELINQGIKPTQRACRVIPGYNSIQRYIPQQKLIDMAMKLE